MRPLTKLLTFLAIAAPNVASATLINRGGGLIYDSVLNITWLQDASLGGVRAGTEAAAWADSLVFGGYDDWRLPLLDVNGDGTFINCASASKVACQDNELGYLYFYGLTPAGDSDEKTDTGTDLRGSQGPLLNIQSTYWSGTPDPSSVTRGLGLDFTNGVAWSGNLGSLTSWAWAVREGNVRFTVPEPSSLLLFGFGLTLLLSRKRSRALSKHA